MAGTEQRDAELVRRIKERMEGDYDSFIRPESKVSAENRVTNALDYIAYQMGQINRNLARVADHLDKQAK